jgi:hypothetical protein
VTGGQRLLVVVLVLVGLLALAAGITYLAVEGKSLPGILGTAHGFTGHRTKRGIAALVVAAVALVGAVALARSSRQPPAS